MHEEVVAVLENCYSDHYLVGTFHAQLRRDQHARESLQEFVAATDHLVHRVHVN
jgi:hypothetical protein